ncbi:MAG TPA: hypothetical protein VKC54_04200 [Patescibacteria group bacterium]|nr:hypothetical protein [Patescibacteria group bacterium]
MGKQFKLIVLVCLAISAVSIFYILNAGNKTPQETPKYPLPEAAAKPEPENSVTSPDGKWTIAMKTEKGKENTSFRFAVTGPEASNKEIFVKTLAKGESLSIPLNTFSPDDKYLFLKQTGVNGASYFVFTTEGVSVGKDVQNADFASLFSAKHENYKITDVTGWGGMHLIVFNTDKVSGGTGPSFWYEVPSGAFIQLNNRFN